LDAISMGDGRELFVLETNYEITVLKSGLCLESRFGNIEDGAKI